MAMMNETSQIAITGMGMLTSVGCSADQSCASLRAGINHAYELKMYRIDAVDVECQAVSGHPVSYVPEDIRGRTRLVCMGAKALEDCLTKTTMHLRDKKRIGIFLSAPSDRPLPVNCLLEDTLKHLYDRTGVNFSESVHCEIATGHAGVIVALQEAVQQMSDGNIDYGFVGGVESYMETDILAWLHQKKRLKTDDNPNGFQPGEAAAFLMVEPLHHAVKRGATIEAVIGGVSVVKEEAAAPPGSAVTGKALSAALKACLASLKDGGNSAGLFIGDVNGEESRAIEWGLTEFRVLSPMHLNYRLSKPAKSIGDTGAASGAIALCTGARALHKNYAGTTTAIVWSVSNSPERGALYLQKYCESVD